MRGIILFIIAALLAVLFMPLGFLYSLIRLWVKANFKTWFKRVEQYFLIIAISIDQTGNVIMQELFNDILIKKGGYLFGNEDETISSVLGKNQQRTTLTLIGRMLNRILHFLEKDHSVMAIEADETMTGTK